MGGLIQGMASHLGTKGRPLAALGQAGGKREALSREWQVTWGPKAKGTATFPIWKSFKVNRRGGGNLKIISVSKELGK